ncbi:hypothetical protein ABIB82_007805 [Bradyrhizobium sp. i1.8.4]
MRLREKISPNETQSAPIEHCTFDKKGDSREHGY